MSILKDFTKVTLVEGEDVSEFDCGNADLNEFLQEDALVYAEELFATTYLFRPQDNPGKVAAFFSLANDKLTVKDIGSGARSRVEGKIPFPKRHPAYPSVLLARLGVDKYFSLEEGLGKLTQEKVTAFGLGNELNLVGKGTLEDVRVAAKQYPMVVVDSFNSLNTKAEEFERLRTDFPNMLFLFIFQKTTAGTIRGGSAIKYNSSATINVIKRDGQRIAIMEKGRYGTIGWEYSITQKQLIKTDDTY